MGDLEWTNELVVRLMQEYRKRPELWDPSHEMYRVQTIKYESWRELAALFECDVTDVRKKLNSLFASHRREKAKIRAGQKSHWFLYPYMSFLPKHLDQPEHGRKGANKKCNLTVKISNPGNEEDTMEFDVSEEELEYQEEEHLEEDPGEGAVEGEEVMRVQVKKEPVVRPYVHVRRALQRPQPRIQRPLKRRAPLPAPAAPTSSLDSRLTEALKLLRRSELTRRKDECDSFGEYIADSLRKHDERTQAMIKQAINNIIFEQEMKKYGAPGQQYVVISGLEDNPLMLSDEGDK